MFYNGHLFSRVIQSHGEDSMFLVGSDSYLLLFHVEKSCAKITVTKCNNSFNFFFSITQKRTGTAICHRKAAE